MNIVCVCVCVIEAERERARDKERGWGWGGGHYERPPPLLSFQNPRIVEYFSMCAFVIFGQMNLWSLRTASPQSGSPHSTFCLKHFQTSKLNQSTRVVKIDVYYTIRPFKRTRGTKVD